ncbi:MAG: hypothetical protein Q7U27_24615 [Pseudomonas sp.]|uniref:Uncharacterized protein n=2 Tax=Pseudomonas fluorescens group TaxID=136843 RepID=A0AB36D5R9_9PSED|nr:MULTISPECIES: hypothetical protein [Pseudomonas]MDO8707491.1 hypothetical protein [Pseudomonas sp.]MDO9331892.1 hypothetical protein [Pseudomonas sp.]NMZ82341.1 hypothetical protein [Pseudomonas mandelii]QZB00755.1 hypothetical protein K3369_14460 [Pseudomonas mandelii]VVO61348.1 hypothetical protein PS870_00807 [Pseudomonas fluorescens]
MNRTMSWSLFVSLATAAVLTVGLIAEADARPRGQGQARASVNRAPAPNAQRAQRINTPPRASNVNAGNRVNSGNRVNAGNTVGNRTNINNSTRNVNINNNRDVDIDVDGHGRYGYDDHYHPIATAAAVTATVAVTAAVVGSILTPAQMPTSCVQVMQYNTVYMQCGSTWYQPQYQGSNVTYVVVNAP